MKLYYHPLSSNARRARMAALMLAPQLRDTVEPVLVNLARGEQRAPAFLQLNPSGKVPVLVDGDFVLSESQAIMQYLAELAPGQTLWPAEAQARADVNHWMFWSASQWTPAVGVLNFEHFVKRMVVGPDARPDPARVAGGEREVRALAQLLDQHLQTRNWLSGERLSLADVSVAVMLMHTETAHLPTQGLPALAAWWGRVRELPAWQATET